MQLPDTYAVAKHKAEREEMVCLVMKLIQAFGDDIRPTNPEWIIGKLRLLLRAGLDNQQHIIARARAGDMLAHKALMREFHEILNEDGKPSAALRAYAAKDDLYPQRGKGADWSVNYLRDFWIVFWVRLICKRYRIAATRNSEPRPNRIPKHCGADVVAEALRRSGHAITEKVVANMCGRCPVWDKRWDKLGLSMSEHVKVIVTELSQRRLNPRQAIEKRVPD